MALPEGPQSRTEQYLAKIAGQDTSLPVAPRSRVEQYLDYIAENGIVSEEEIAEQVSTWLEENITEDPTVVIDTSLSVTGAAADAKAAGDGIREANEALLNQPTYITSTRTYINAAAVSRTHNGITFTRTVNTGIYNNEYTISGTSGSSMAFVNIYGATSVVPMFFLMPGEYTVALDTNDDGIGIRIVIYPENGDYYLYDVVGRDSITFTLPKIVGILIRYQVAANATVNGTAKVLMTHTFNPYIKSTNDTTDRANEINHRLYGCGACFLLPGTFYAKTIRMPIGSMLSGCGEASKIYVDQSVINNAIITSEKCTVCNLSLYGSETDITLDGNVVGVGNGTQTRCGILWGTEGARSIVISKCRFLGFTCAGIMAADTGGGSDCGGSISDCFFTNNNVGIYIRKDSEYLKITNCTISRNYYGYLNRGGNNDLCGCSVDSNVINAQIDEDEGTNNGHGTITGCSFNHANLNEGYGLIIKNTGRMIVSNCNFYYSKVLLQSTNGNVINGCGFGSECALEITGGSCNLITNCIVKSTDEFPITLTNNSTSRMINCFTRTGTQVELPA